jgi:SAM-dependent methyltransferase
MTQSNIQEVESYWDSRPCNIRHSPAPLGSLRWSREVTERKYLVEPHIPKFAEFEKWQGKRVLEIGCGIGTDTLEFLKHGATVDAVDLSDNSIDLARQRVNKELGSSSPVNFFHANAEEGLSFLPSATYDLVYSFGVIHHTPHPVRILAAALKKLKPYGELRVMLYAKWSWKNLVGQQPEAQAGCPIARRFSTSEAVALLEACGFSILSTQKAHIFPWRVEDYVEYRYVKAFPWNLVPEPVFGALESTLGWHLLIKAKPMAIQSCIGSPIPIMYGERVKCEF